MEIFFSIFLSSQQWRSGEANNRELAFFVSGRALRSREFLYCLATGVPCVSSDWIVHVRRKKKYVDYGDYRLTAGHDELNRVDVPWRPRKHPLTNLRLGICGDLELTEFWTAIVTVGRGELVLVEAENFDELADLHLDVVMVDTAAPRDLMKTCRREVIPLVTQLWLVHTLIYGKKRAFQMYPPKLSAERKQ